MYERGTEVVVKGARGLKAFVDSVYSNVNGVYYEVVFRENDEYSRKDTRGWFKESEVEAVSKLVEALSNSGIYRKMCLVEASNILSIYLGEDGFSDVFPDQESIDNFALEVSWELFDGDLIDSDYVRYIFEDMLREKLGGKTND